jgi:diguanylate cyclase (GGDEF)-like protein
MFPVIHYVTYVGIVAHSGFIALFWWLHVPVMALFNVFSVAAWVAARVANERGRPRLAALLLFVEVTAHAVLAVHILGWHSGFHYYLIPVIPFLMFHDRLATRTVIAGSALVAAIYIALRATTFDLEPSWIRRDVLMWVGYLNIVVPFLALAVISIYFRFASMDVERKMAALAMTDALTRLPNRRRMRELLEAERVRFARGGRTFGIIIGDVDGFKQINDTLGHECGDHALREVASVLRSALRAQDAVARWGGEEFLFLLPETDLAETQVVAEKLRAAVERAGLDYAGKPLTVTMTFGVAASVPGTSVDDCLRFADEALYVGKEHGKNRVVALPAQGSA